VITQYVDGKNELKSSYIQYLPALYQDDKFMGQFLMIFESIMKPIENSVDSLELYFDPQMTPESILPWLASWLDLALDQTWPMERRRQLVKHSAELYRWRGTRRGLSKYLKIYTGIVPKITEYIPGMRLHSDTKLGIDTKLGSSGRGHHFTVSLELGANDDVNDDTVRAIIDAQKPAHTHYTLEIKRNGRRMETMREG